MKTNIFKSKAMRLGALALLGGAVISTTGCGNDKINKLFFTVKGDDLEVVFCDRGASIYSIKYKGQFVTYHPKDKKTFISDNFYGKCLGRVAGRIPDGELRIGDREYNLEINETKDGKNNCLHGGKDGLSTKDWEHEIVEKSDYYQVTFKYLSKTGESGFPENLNVKYVYKVSKTDGELSLVIDAGSSGLTPVDLSFHPYIRLGNSGLAKDHTLTIKADNIAKYDAEGHQTVIGIDDVEKKVVEGVQPWNFKNGKKIGAHIDQARREDSTSGGYDHIWYFGANEEEKTRTCSLTLSNNYDIQLDVTSEDSDAVIMYANCWKVEGQEMNDGEKDTTYAAITIEPYTFFTTEQKSIEKIFIDRNKSFTRHITYKFSSI